MSLMAIARLEQQRLARAPGLWLTTLAFGILMASGVALPWLTLSDPSAAAGSAFLLGPATDLLLPVIVILLTYGAVAGHRERGSIHVLLGLPVSRGGLFGGLLLARLTATLVILAVGLVVGIVTILLLYGVPPLRPVLGFVGLTVLTVLSLTCLGVGVSASIRSPHRALGGLLGGFIVAQWLWEPLLEGGAALLAGTDTALFRLAERLSLLSPTEAYSRAADGLLPPSPHLMLAIEDGDTTAERGATVGGEIASTELGIALGVLVAWGIIGVLVGRHRFLKAEID